MCHVSYWFKLQLPWYMAYANRTAVIALLAIIYYITSILLMTAQHKAVITKRLHLQRHSQGNYRYMFYACYRAFGHVIQACTASMCDQQHLKSKCKIFCCAVKPMYSKTRLLKSGWQIRAQQTSSSRLRNCCKTKGGICLLTVQLQACLSSRQAISLLFIVDAFCKPCHSSVSAMVIAA